MFISLYHKRGEKGVFFFEVPQKKIIHYFAFLLSVEWEKKGLLKKHCSAEIEEYYYLRVTDPDTMRGWLLS